MFPSGEMIALGAPCRASDTSAPSTVTFVAVLELIATAPTD